MFLQLAQGSSPFQGLRSLVSLPRQPGSLGATARCMNVRSCLPIVTSPSVVIKDGVLWFVPSSLVFVFVLVLLRVLWRWVAGCSSVLTGVMIWRFSGEVWKLGSTTATTKRSQQRCSPRRNTRSPERGPTSEWRQKNGQTLVVFGTVGFRSRLVSLDVRWKERWAWGAVMLLPASIYWHKAHSRFLVTMTSNIRMWKISSRLHIHFKWCIRKHVMRDLAGDFGKKKIPPPQKNHGSHREMKAEFDDFSRWLTGDILFTDLGFYCSTDFLRLPCCHQHWNVYHPIFRVLTDSLGFCWSHRASTSSFCLVRGASLSHPQKVQRRQQKKSISEPDISETSPREMVITVIRLRSFRCFLIIIMNKYIIDIFCVRGSLGA